MNNITNTFAKVSIAFVIVLVSVVGMSQPAYAQYDDWFTDSSLGSVPDYGSGYDNWYTDSGWGSVSNYGSNDGWGYANDGWGYANDGWGYANDGWGYANDGWGYANDGWGSTNDGWGYANDGSCSTCYEYVDGVGYSYTDYGYSDYYTSSGSPSTSQPFSFAAPGYSASAVSVGRPTSVGYSTASYSTPTYTYSTPTYTYPSVRPTCAQYGMTGTYPNCRAITQPTSTTQPITIVNTNTNTNTNVNTAPVTPVYQTPITYPVQYVYPTTYTYPTYTYPQYYGTGYTYPQHYGNLSCAISASPSTVQDGQAAYLSWTSTGATSAWISDGIGAVAVNGTLAVRPGSSRTYTLTISNGYGTQTCNTYVAVAGYATAVSLSQIPYTGFDLGLLGNSLYWLSLIAFAGAGAYLMVYYRGGAVALAGAMTGQMGAMIPRRTRAAKLVVPTHTPVTTQASAPASINAFAGLPVAQRAETTDMMVLARSKGGEAPRLIITRE